MHETVEDQATLLARLLEPLGRCLTPDVARGFVNLRAEASVQARLDELADKSTAGALTDAERVEYETYVHAIDFIADLQAHARRLTSSTSAAGTICKE
jgi:hypothetical protein